MGGGDKTAAVVGGETLLRRVLAGLPGDATAVVVGGAGDLPPDVLSAREDPPLTGPAAAVLAGWRVLREQPGWAPRRRPGAGRRRPVHRPGAAAAAGALARWPGPGVAPLSPGPAAAVAADPGGVVQPLLAAFTAAALDAAGRADAGGRSARSLLHGLAVVTVPVTADEAADVDTPADLAAARARVAGAPDPAGGARS